MQQDPNYGSPREPDSPVGGPIGSTGGPIGSSTEMSAQDERTWSMIAHLSVLAGLIGLMPLGALLVWLIYKDKSPRVRFHSAQALWYQIAWLVILVVGWIITGLLSVVIIGLLLIPIMLIASLVPFVHGCYAAYKVNQGVDYRYPVIADMVDGTRRTA